MAGPSSNKKEGGKKKQPADKQPAEQKVTCTDQEGRFFFAIIKHMKGKPDIDWEAVADEAGYNSPATAKVRFLISEFIHSRFMC
jgi:hypothetical protein